MEDLRPEKIKKADKLGRKTIRNNFLKGLSFKIRVWFFKNRKKILKLVFIFFLLFVIFSFPKKIGSFFGSWYYDITTSFIENVNK